MAVSAPSALPAGAAGAASAVDALALRWQAWGLSETCYASLLAGSHARRSWVRCARSYLREMADEPVLRMIPSMSLAEEALQAAEEALEKRAGG